MKRAGFYIFSSLLLVGSAVWGDSTSSNLTDMLCEDAIRNAGLIGPPSLKLGEKLQAIDFPVTQISAPSMRAEDLLETTRYKTSGKFGNNPGLEIETINCSGTQIVVGIWGYFGAMGPIDFAEWKEIERNALKRATGVPGTLTKIDQTFSLRAVKAQLDLKGGGRTVGQTTLIRQCRIDPSQSDKCIFTGAVVEDLFFVINAADQ